MALKAVRCSMMKLMVLVMTAVFVVEASVLKNNFYKESCPIAEEIVTKVVERHLARDPTLAPALLRMHFHDCFVRVSWLLTLYYLKLLGIINKLYALGMRCVCASERKRRKQGGEGRSAEQVTEGIRSDRRCKERARERVSQGSVVLGRAGIGSKRRGIKRSKRTLMDSKNRAQGRNCVIHDRGAAKHTISVDECDTAQGVFRRQRAQVKDMVVLSGAHSVGLSHCTSVNQRIFNFTGVVGTSDPAMDEHYVKRLKTKCSLNGNPKSTVAMDPATPMSLDSSYYRLVMQRRVVFQSDSTLMSDPSTAKMVSKQLHQPHFLRNFAHSMTRMSEISVLTGSQGSIRTRCDFVPS